MKETFLVVLFVFTIQNSEAVSTMPPPKECEETTVTLKSEFKSRNKYFFFRKTSHKKGKRFDRIINSKGNIVMEIMMKSDTKGDEYLFRKFHRLVIVENEIHEVICKTGKEKGKVIVYNFCGEQLRKTEMKSDELYDKYGF